MLKSILKVIDGLVIGISAGFLIGALISVCIIDATFTTFFNKMLSINWGEALLAVSVGILAFILSVLIHVSIHETGHLVCGLFSGYNFVSYRIFNWTFVKIENKIRIRKFSISGTGGQCLLSPPEMKLEKLPTAWYNIGGVLANIITVAFVCPLLLLKGHPFIIESAVIFIFTGLFFILVNGIPLKVSGMGNDAYNMLALRKNLISKRGLVLSLKTNALIQNGIRPKDMPEEWFAVPENINYKNQLEIAIPLMSASRLIDELRFEDALEKFEELYSKRLMIADIYVKEIACELVFLRLFDGNREGAKALLDKSLTQYIEMYRQTMSSKQRIKFAISLFWENDEERAKCIYDELKKNYRSYLLQGEVKSDLAIMEHILRV